MSFPSCGDDAGGQPGDTAPEGCPGPAPGWDTGTGPVPEAEHCPLMLPPGTGAGKPSGACSLHPGSPAGALPRLREKRRFFRSCGEKARSRAWFGGTPRDRQRCQTLNSQASLVLQPYGGAAVVPSVLA